MPTLNPAIFREYDIRGVADRDLTTQTSRACSAAPIGTFRRATAGKRRITLGRDCRLHARTQYADALKDGLARRRPGRRRHRRGADAARSTSRVYHLDVDGGVQITGSHNPPRTTASRSASARARSHGDDDPGRSREIIEARDFVATRRAARGALRDHPRRTSTCDYVSAARPRARKLQRRRRRRQRRRRAGRAAPIIAALGLRQ